MLGRDHPLLIVDDEHGPRPRVLVRHGLEAELARPVYYELAEIALAEGHDPPGIWSDGAFFPLDSSHDAWSTALRAALAASRRMPPLTATCPRSTRCADVAAAVLIAITDRDEPGVILTVRRDDMRTHAGQIAFPGGRIDPGRGRVAAALARSIGGARPRARAVELVGAIEPYRTVTGFVVTPVIGVIPPDLPLAPHEHEVADWFEAPLAFVLDPANQQQQARCSRAGSATITRSTGTAGGFGGQPRQ